MIGRLIGRLVDKKNYSFERKKIYSKLIKKERHHINISKIQYKLKAIYVIDYANNDKQDNDPH